MRIQWDQKNNSDYAKIWFTRRRMHGFRSIRPENLFGLRRFGLREIYFVANREVPFMKIPVKPVFLSPDVRCSEWQLFFFTDKFSSLIWTMGFDCDNDYFTGFSKSLDGNQGKFLPCTCILSNESFWIIFQMFRYSDAYHISDEAMDYLVKHLLGIKNEPVRPSHGELTPLVDLFDDDDNNNQSQRQSRLTKSSCCAWLHWSRDHVVCGPVMRFPVLHCCSTSCFHRTHVCYGFKFTDKLHDSFPVLSESNKLHSPTFITL